MARAKVVSVSTGMNSPASETKREATGKSNPDRNRCKRARSLLLEASCESRAPRPRGGRLQGSARAETAGAVSALRQLVEARCEHRAPRPQSDRLQGSCADGNCGSSFRPAPAELCDDVVMPRIPTSPVTAAYVLYRAWRRLPPRQRRLLLDVARTHGPTVAAKAATVTKRVVAN